RRRTKDPRQILYVGIGIVTLHTPRDQHRHGNDDEPGRHDVTPRLACARSGQAVDRRRRPRSMLTQNSNVLTIAATQMTSGSAPLVAPTARLLTPAGKGNG